MGFAPFFLLNPVFHILHRLCVGAHGATEEHVPHIYSVPDDPAAAVRTRGRQGMDGALETVENVRLAAGSHFKGFIVLVAAYFACSHRGLLFCSLGTKNLFVAEPCFAQRFTELVAETGLGRKVLHANDIMCIGATNSTEKETFGFDAMPGNPAAAMRAGGCHAIKSALEAVEDLGLVAEI
jgi:hypothetical protein